MNMLPKIICRTIGTAGMGLALYDAIKVGGQTSRNRGEEAQGKYLEKAFGIRITKFESDGRSVYLTEPK